MWLAVAAAWLAFVAGVVIGGARDAPSVALAVAAGGAFAWLGVSAASRCRTLARRTRGERARLAVLAVAAGAALGLANLAANWAIAESDPALRRLLTERFARIGAIEPVVAAPLMEEVGVRLFLMSALAWAVFRLTARATLALGVALVASSLFFASLHLARPLPVDPALADYYRAALLVKYTLAGLPLGWIYWRWGLPYSIVCHAAANAAHLALHWRVF